MWYERCAAETECIAEAFSALGAAIDEHDDTLGRLEQEVAGDARQKEFLAWLQGQRRRLDELREIIDDQAHDRLLRVADRTIRIKHWEDGEFV